MRKKRNTWVSYFCMGYAICKWIFYWPISFCFKKGPRYYRRISRATGTFSTSEGSLLALKAGSRNCVDWRVFRGPSCTPGVSRWSLLRSHLMDVNLVCVCHYLQMDIWESWLGVDRVKTICINFKSFWVRPLILVINESRYNSRPCNEARGVQTSWCPRLPGTDTRPELRTLSQDTRLSYYITKKEVRCLIEFTGLFDWRHFFGGNQGC